MQSLILIKSKERASRHAVPQSAEKPIKKILMEYIIFFIRKLLLH